MGYGGGYYDKCIANFFSINHKFISIGLLGVLFIDVGSISYNILNLNETPKIIGSGMGIRIPFPMLHVIRFDLGWGYRNGKWNKGTLHWGVSHKF